MRHDKEAYMETRGKSTIEGASNTAELRKRLDDNRKISSQPWWIRIQVYVVAVAFAMVAVACVGLVMPFTPFHLYGWGQVPPTVCPGEALNTSYDSEVEGGWYTIKKMEGSATILKDGRVVDAYPVDQELDAYPRRTMVSLVQRTAPLEQGMYNFGYEATIYGRMFGLVPRYQEVDFVSTQTFMVLDDDNPKCDITQKGG